MSDIRGKDPQGDFRDVSVTEKGDILVAARVFKTARIIVPGIGAAAAYAAGDAFGDKFRIQVPREGTIATVVFLDLDDEGLQKDLVFFTRDFTATADNAAFAVSDVDLLHCAGVAPVTEFYNFSSNQVGIATPALSYVAPSGFLWCQIVTRGADNIAAGAEPSVFMGVV